MKLNQEELYLALCGVINNIETAGASPELTAASMYVSDLRQAVGNQWNPADGYAAERVLDRIGGPREMPVPEGLKEFQPHERRVIAEYQELQDRITKLHGFLVDNEKLAKLQPGDIDDLIDQHRAMLAYNDILIRQIDKFSKGQNLIGPEAAPTPAAPTAVERLTTVAKSFRKFLDDVLQRMKAHRDMLTTPGLLIDGVEDQREMVANHILSLRHVEDAIMRQGMALKCIGATPNPYPQSYNPESPAIEPTADGLKL